MSEEVSSVVLRARLKKQEIKYSCLNLETASRDEKMHVLVEMGHIDQVNCGVISAALACFTGLFFYRAKPPKPSLFIWTLLFK